MVLIYASNLCLQIQKLSNLKDHVMYFKTLTGHGSKPLINDGYNLLETLQDLFLDGKGDCEDPS